MKILIWIVIAVVVIGGGFYLVNHSSVGNQNQSPTTLQNSVPVSSNDQSSGCESKYVSAGEIASALGLSSQTTLSSESSYASLCDIYWKDSQSNSMGTITIMTGFPSASQTTKIDCNKGTPLSIGDVSCSLNNPAAQGGSEIIIAKGDSTVTIFPTSAKAISTDQLSALGSLITSRI